MHKSLDEFEFRPDPHHRRLQSELIGWESKWRLCVRPSVRPQYTFNHEFSETGRPIAIIFYMKHHWGRGKAALGFGADQIRTQDPGDNKTLPTPPTMTISYAKLIIGTTYIQKRLLFSKLNLGGDIEIVWFL